ncbi:TPA: phage tail protein, partial [Acinetobacter baumannii]|nr:phage tail protein [Acinetobacter baumannii]
TAQNTTTDGNGFIKAASPIVKLFNDHIELNDEAERQPITFDKLGTGDYLVKGSLGFAQEGWYIEVPKDANGNTIVA